MCIATVFVPKSNLASGQVCQKSNLASKEVMAKFAFLIVHILIISWSSCKSPISCCQILKVILNIVINLFTFFLLSCRHTVAQPRHAKSARCSPPPTTTYESRRSTPRATVPSVRSSLARPSPPPRRLSPPSEWYRPLQTLFSYSGQSPVTVAQRSWHITWILGRGSPSLWRGMLCSTV